MGSTKTPSFELLRPRRFTRSQLQPTTSQAESKECTLASEQPSIFVETKEFPVQHLSSDASLTPSFSLKGLDESKGLDATSKGSQTVLKGRNLRKTRSIKVVPIIQTRSKTQSTQLRRRSSEQLVNSLSLLQSSAVLPKILPSAIVDSCPGITFDSSTPTPITQLFHSEEGNTTPTYLPTEPFSPQATFTPTNNSVKSLCADIPSPISDSLYSHGTSETSVKVKIEPDFSSYPSQNPSPSTTPDRLVTSSQPIVISLAEEEQALRLIRNTKEEKIRRGFSANSHMRLLQSYHAMNTLNITQPDTTSIENAGEERPMVKTLLPNPRQLSFNTNTPRSSRPIVSKVPIVKPGTITGDRFATLLVQIDGRLSIEQVSVLGNSLSEAPAEFQEQKQHHVKLQNHPSLSSQSYHSDMRDKLIEMDNSLAPGSPSRFLKRAQLSVEELVPRIVISYDEKASCHGCAKRLQGLNHMTQPIFAFPEVMFCTRGGDSLRKRCKKKFCVKCLRDRYGIDFMDLSHPHKWICPGCTGQCVCRACVNSRDRLLFRQEQEQGRESEELGHESEDQDSSSCEHNLVCVNEQGGSVAAVKGKSREEDDGECESGNQADIDCEVDNGSDTVCAENNQLTSDAFCNTLQRNERSNKICLAIASYPDMYSHSPFPVCSAPTSESDESSPVLKAVPSSPMDRVDIQACENRAIEKNTGLFVTSVLNEKRKRGRPLCAPSLDSDDQGESSSSQLESTPKRRRKNSTVSCSSIVKPSVAFNMPDLILPPVKKQVLETSCTSSGGTSDTNVASLNPSKKEIPLSMQLPLYFVDDSVRPTVSLFPRRDVHGGYVLSVVYPRGSETKREIISDQEIDSQKDRHLLHGLSSSNFLSSSLRAE